MPLLFFASLATWLLFVIFTYLGYASDRFAWFGVGKFKRPDNDYRRHRTLWDWLILLIIPVVLAVGVIGFSTQQSTDNFDLSATQYANNQSIAATRYANDLHIAATRYAEDQQLAQEQQIETNLQTYLDRMSDLLLNPNLHAKSQLGDNVRILATARTLTILQGLDATRKAVVLKFLINGGLIGRQDPKSLDIINPVVNFNGADFSGEDLTRFSLNGADLALVNFTGVMLNEANLSGADLSGANLSGAQMQDATLCFAMVTNNAQVSDANLTGALLGGTDFTGADLTGAKLIRANMGLEDPVCVAQIRPKILLCTKPI